MNQSQLKFALDKHHLKPSKKLGQNFLISQPTINRVIEAADLKPGDRALEIGPGLGALTFELAKKTKQVLAVEKDRGLARALQTLVKEKGVKNVKVIEEDILKVPATPVLDGTGQAPVPFGTGQANYQLQTTNYKLISNLPYNIATAVLMKFLAEKHPPELMVVLLQKEVAQRLVAQPPKMNKLAVFSQLYSQPKLVKIISKNNFYPKPKVDSALLKITNIQQNLPKINCKTFAQVVKAGFSQPRKQLINNLCSLNCQKSKKDKASIKKWLLQSQTEPSQRPQTLTLSQWVKLAQTCPFL